MSKKKKPLWIIPVAAVILLFAVFFIWAGQYYHAQPEALQYLVSDGTVTVTQTEYGWYFDGPSEEDALIFYPGAKVEETAYAPLCHRLAAEGMDVCLIKMPLRLAFLGTTKADVVISMYDYDNWYLGGHSLGGAMSSLAARIRMRKSGMEGKR